MVYRLSFGICSLNLAVVLVAIVANQTVENSDNEAIVCSFLTPFQCSTQVQVPIRQVLSACFGHLGNKTIIATIKKMKGRVRWDEANLAEIEANKPTRQNIDEPKTPYPPVIGADDSVGSPDYSTHSEALRNALNEAVSSQKNSTNFGRWTSSSDDEANGMKQDKDFVKIRHGTSFTDHRRKHYDEFWRVKELKKKGCFLENENGDQDNDAAGRYDSSALFSDGLREIHIAGDHDHEINPQTIVIQGDADESLPKRQFLPCTRS